MSVRLDELRRQRALVQEHLAWLDREIAAAAEPLKSTVTVATIAPAASPPTITKAGSVDAGSSSASLSSVGSIPSIASAASNAAALPGDPVVEKILEEYRVAPDAVRQDVRKGCFLYFAAACVFFALVVVALHFSLRSR